MNVNSLKIISLSPWGFFFVAVLLIGMTVSALAQAAQPNVIFILADDMGVGDVQALYPEGKIQTPHLDALVEGGMHFTDMHTTSGVCTPTRYSLLTGRYNWRSTLQNGVLWGASQPLIPEERMTVADVFKAGGYNTACVGKWHLGLGWGKLKGDKVAVENMDHSAPVTGGPNALGFDYSFIIPASLDMQPYVYVEDDRVVQEPTDTIEEVKGKKFYRGGPIAPDFDHEQCLPELKGKALEWIRGQEKEDAPFFLYFPLPAPHTPILPTKDYRGKSGVNEYGDFVMQVDGLVGEVAETLKATGQYENTLIIFSTDNGCSPMADFKELKAKGHLPSGPYRGHKADIYEGGHRVPFIAHWPKGVAAGSRSDQILTQADFMATIAEMLGVEVPDTAGEDSLSFLSVLQGTDEGPIHEAVVHHSINGSFAIRQGKWKLAFCPGSGGWSKPRPKDAKKQDLPEFQLFNLEEDRGETHNYYGKHPEVIEGMYQLMSKYIDHGRSTPGARQPNDVAVKLIKK